MKKKILFVNSSPNFNGNTAKLAHILLEGQQYEIVNLVDYKIYAFGQNFNDDEFDLVIDKLKKVDILVIGSPLYWHNINGMLRNFLDRCYGKVHATDFKGKDLYFVIQGATPEKWQLDACEFTMNRFCALYGLNYQGRITDSTEARNSNLKFK